LVYYWIYYWVSPMNAELQVVTLSAQLQGCKDELQYTKDKLIDLCVRAIESRTEVQKIKLRKELAEIIKNV